MLLATLFIGALLRILALTQHDFWYDEAFTYFVAKLDIKSILAVTTSDANPPLYYILMHYIATIGKSEVILRLPSLVAGLITVTLTHAIVKKFISEKASLPTAAFVSVSPLTIYLSTEARPHSLGILLATAAVFTFLSTFKKPTPANSAIFIGVMVIGLYTHYYIALLLVVFTFIVIFKKENRLSLKSWLVILLLSGIAFLPWTISTLGASHNKCWCPKTFLSLPASLVSPAAAGVGMITLRTFPNLPKMQFLFLTLVSTSTLIYFFKGALKNRSLTALYFGPLLILSAAGLSANIFSPKAFAIFSPIYFSILALGASSSAHKKLLIPTLTLAFAAISIWQSQDEFFKGDRLKQALHQVKTKNIPILHTSATTFYTLKYYTGDNAQNFLIGENTLNSIIVNYIGGQKLQNLPQTSAIWVIDNYRWDKNGLKSTEAKQAILNGYEIQETYQFDTITVSYLKRKK